MSNCEIINFIDVIIFEFFVLICSKCEGPPPGGLEPPTFRLTAERANRLRHGGHESLRKKNNQKQEREREREREREE